MGPRRVSLVDLGRAVGDGWCAFVRGAVCGEALLLPGGSLGIGGEAFPDMNVGYVFGPDGVGEAVRRFHRLLSERRLPGSIAVLSPATGEAAEAAPARPPRRWSEWPARQRGRGHASKKKTLGRLRACARRAGGGACCGDFHPFVSAARRRLIS